MKFRTLRGLPGWCAITFMFVGRTLSAADPHPIEIFTVPHAGDAQEDKEIQRRQQQLELDAGNADSHFPALINLGWAFCKKARTSFDPGYYKLAEQAGEAGGRLRSDDPEALLLLGETARSLHRFSRAEEIGRKLVQKRGGVLDYALLGDSLLEQGRVSEAAGIYQQMIDLKPCLASHSRGAHLRWIKGDVDGAIELYTEAAACGNPRDPEPLAWVYVQRARLQFQTANEAGATASFERALELVPGYPPALLLKGRILLAGGDAASAVPPLRAAASKNPLPEYQWALAEALESAGEDAERTRRLLETDGANTDPRSLSLYLATSGEQTTEAVRLAKAELEHRADFQTKDALAWALLRDGRTAEAAALMERALAEGTVDARIALHAVLCFFASGETKRAENYLQAACSMQHMLLPSEKSLLMTHQKPSSTQIAATNKKRP